MILLSYVAKLVEVCRGVLFVGVLSALFVGVLSALFVGVLFDPLGRTVTNRKKVR